jgi:N-[(2S)-2-amino-2-carboxyethyl]-L-glutamate dehydrogenase
MIPSVRVEMTFLSQDDVVGAGGTDMPAVIDVIEGAFRLKATGQVINPQKVMLTWSDEPATQEKHGRIMAMPAWVGGDWDVAGLKWIPSVPANLGRGLPRANALVVLSDRETGLPVAVMDGTIVSAMRTGGVTGVAIRHLSSPTARTAGLLGAGVLTRTQLMALAATRPGLDLARVYDPDTARTERLLEAMRGELPFPVAVARSEQEACEGADIIIPSTLATEPTIRKEWVPGGGLVVLVSSLDGPLDLHEVTDLLVVDDRNHEGTAHERYLRRLCDAGLARLEDAVELSEIAAGIHPGRTSPGQRIVCSPVGLGMEDVVCGAYVLKNARERGLGTPLRVRDAPLWT